MEIVAFMLKVHRMFCAKSSTINQLIFFLLEQNVYYSDGVKIFYTNYTTPNGQNELYQETFASSITDLDVAGDYVYYVGSNNL